MQSIFILFSFSALYSLGYVMASLVDNIKQKSWVHTLCASVIQSMTFISAIIAVVWCGWPAIQMYQSTNFSDTLIIFPLVKLGEDLYLMVHEYPFALIPWVHHVGYALSLWISYQYRITGSILLVHAMEIPTVFLAMGYVWPNQRRNYITYPLVFIFRIVYHGWLIWLFYQTRHDSPVPEMWVIAAILWLIHVHWFYKIMTRDHMTL